MMNELISCIITTYNREDKLIKRAIKSVLQQTYKNKEIILVDDNDEDSYFRKHVENSVKNIDTKEKIRLIRHKKNLGAQVARNTGIENANGEFIAFLDDDDEWLPNKLAFQLEKFKKHPQNNLGLVYCSRYNVKDISVGKTKVTLENAFKPKNDIILNLARNNFIGSTSFPLIKKEVFREVGYFDTELKAKQDYDMWLRIAQKYNVDYVSEPLCIYYSHSDERITTNIKKKLSAEITFLKKHYEIISKDNIAMAIKHRHIGKYYYKLNKHREAIKHFVKSFRYNKLDIKTYAWLILSCFKIKV